MKNLLNKIVMTALTLGLSALLGLISVQQAAAQRYLTEIRASNETKAVAQFADNLSSFLELAEAIESGQRNDAIYMKIDNIAKKVKDGTGSLRSGIKTLIANFKSRNQWNDELDNQINESLGSRRIKGFFQRNGGRKILTDAEAATAAINAEVDAILVNLKKLRASGAAGGSVFMQTSFAPTASARKVKFKCVVLGVAIFGAELVKASRTAENLDGFFDKSCGAGANTAT